MNMRSKSWSALSAIWLVANLLVLVACAPSTIDETVPAVSTQNTVGMANPASVNCAEQGGRLVVEARGDGGQFGVCIFDDNRQCEEWALLRGNCPVGGLKVTGYITDAARYCAITGGEYTITSKGGAEDEQGTCTFPDGSQCDVWSYYNGQCSPGTHTPAADWQTYTNAEAGFSLQVPPGWNEKPLPDQSNGMIHGLAFSGSEEGVEVYWGVGFGGACPAGYTTVLLAQGEAQTCYTKRDDGTELWDQIAYQVEGGNSFSSRAYTSNAEPASHDLVLQVLATLTFMPPAQGEAGATIQPLVVEVCDGQAQAMAHSLDVLEVTQSEAALSDPVIGASGVGCMATVAGNGTQFASPQAVVDTLGSMLEGQGWTEDPMLAAGGPTGTSEGYRQNDQVCVVSALWKPDDSANCPQDQPISACEVTPEQQLYTITLNCGVESP